MLKVVYVIKHTMENKMTYLLAYIKYRGMSKYKEEYNCLLLIWETVNCSLLTPPQSRLKTAFKIK